MQPDPPRDVRVIRAAIARRARQIKLHGGDPMADQELKALREEYRSARFGKGLDSLFQAMPQLSASEKLEEYIRATVASAPPLSDEQRERLASLLRAA